METLTSSVTIGAQMELPGRHADAAQSVAEKLRGLQRILIGEIKANRRKTNMAAVIGEFLIRTVDIEAAWYFQREGDDGKSPIWQYPRRADDAQTSVLRQRVVDACNRACELGDVHLQGLGDNDRCIVAIPVYLDQQLPDSIGLVVSTRPSLEQAIAILHAVVPYVTLWSVLHGTGGVSSDVLGKAKLIDILASTPRHDNLRDESHRLAGELQRHLVCSCVALGWIDESSTACRLLAVSGKANFDRHSDFARAVEAALDETLWRGEFTVYPPSNNVSRHMTLALQRLCSVHGADVAVSAPLEDGDAKRVGAWIFLGDCGFNERRDAIAFIRDSQRFVGSHLRLVRNAQCGPVARLARAAAANHRTWRGKAALAAACIVAAILAAPMRYRITCDCQAQPVVRRYVAAPYDGKLEQVMVAPGDLVASGAVLARMDGRPIRWELAGLVAEHSRVMKQRDVALAGHDAVTSQVAKLELQRLDLNIQILERRAEHLEIKSTIDGLVISGDQQRAEGAPLSIGQTLFEIAPLDKMTVDVAVPECDVAFVRDKLKVVIRLDAYPKRIWSGTIAKFHPRSENKNGQNVFIAEVHLDNPDGAMRPGMNGRAKIIADSRSIAWNLFHRPWEMVMSSFGG